ncbi:hypothetical protein [Exiguobacterium sp. S22-S28]|uniref:hypothetical protein n=1 Tax=Exiguobacterium sp. S22-S28 TaxID=3342768 RepID=UPI00372D824B
MPTTNFNLPKIENTNTADVVRDLNALADAADVAIKTAKDKADAAVPTSQKGQPSGVATLGTDGKVPTAQLPTIASTANDITIADTANYYSSSNVEGALAEIGQTLAGTRTSIVTTAQQLGVM